MSKGNTFEDDILKLIFNGTPIPNLADNAAAAPLSNVYLSLHNADPGEGGSQSTSEVSYGGYARVAVSRNTSGWVILNGSASPVSAIEFGEMASGTPGTATHAVIGTAASGSGKILYKGSLTPAIALNVGVVPRLRTTSTITED